MSENVSKKNYLFLFIFFISNTKYIYTSFIFHILLFFFNFNIFLILEWLKFFIS